MRVASIPCKDGSLDSVPTYTVNEIKDKLYNLKCKNLHVKNKKQWYLEDFATFDIETTTIISEAPYGFMYHWQFSLFNQLVITGRTWEEFSKLLEMLAKHFNLYANKKLIIYVHNLGFEFQFIKDFLLCYDDINVFATKKREPIYCTCDELGLEFRCSQRLSNMSLNKFTTSELYGKHIKAAGDLDYRILRIPTTELDDKEFGYCIADVVALYDAVKSKMKSFNDDLASIPLTSTGYVRRDTRSACRKFPKYREQIFNKSKITPPVYNMAVLCSRGGNTHANRYMSGKIFHEYDSFDVQSSYPSVMLLMDGYPIRSFMRYGEIESEEEFRSLLNEYACMFKITLLNAKVHDNVSVPYIPKYKCENLISGKFDNGRVLSGSFTIAITNIDFPIIESQYDYDSYYISDMFIAKKGFLPEPIREQVAKYFRSKCELKQKRKKCEKGTPEYDDLDYLYSKSKNLLNAIFGMCLTSIVKPKATINHKGEWEEEPEDIEKSIEKYNNSRNSFLSYTWGVFITAFARAHLQRLIDICDEVSGGLMYYCDTDSAKVAYSEKLRKRIEEENQKIIARNEQLGITVDVEGTKYYYGIYELETKDAPYKEFCSLGAKKYVYTDDKGLHITISGVNKSKGAEELGSIDNFKPGFKFSPEIKQSHYYNDDHIHKITIQGCTFTTASNIGIVDSGYTLGITDEYAELIGYNIYENE